MPRRISAACLGFLAVGGLIASSVIPVPSANADSNESLTVRTQVHVDSPHAVWQDNNFSLVSKSSGMIPIEKTINWVSKGKVDRGLYAWNVPEDERLEFLGKKDQLMYYGGPAHGSPSDGMPIWAGFGASIDLPTEKFRDESFNLDIVDFDGPGKMELFTYSDEDMPLQRLWSSHDAGYRSTWVEKGSHTHNATTFTRPGLYEISYRASARGKDGKLIASEPQKLIWQVGGPDPADAKLGNVKEAYDKASESANDDASGTFNPEFTMSPDTGNAYGAKKGLLTKLDFTTGNTKDSGHAVFYIDGYYLAEVPVKEGKATWSEMIGSLESKFQVVYIPGEDSQSPSWVSKELEHATGSDKNSTKEEGSFPEAKAEEPREEFDLKDIKPTSLDVAVSTSEINSESGESFDLTVKPKDDRLTVNAVGGFYEKESGKALSSVPKDRAASCPITFTSAPDNRTSRQIVDGCEGENYQLLLDIIPSSRTEAPGKATVIDSHDGKYRPLEETTVTLGNGKTSEESEDEQSDESGETSDDATSEDDPADESEDGGEPEESTGTTTSSKPDKGKTPEKGKDSKEPESASGVLSKEKVEISKGHVDISPKEIDNTLAVVVKDESGQHSSKAVLRDPNSVTFVVPQSAKTLLKGDIKDIAKKGERVYMLPEVQKTGLVWPGFSTEEIYGVTEDNYEFTITPKSTPQGGKWVAYSGDANSSENRIGDSSGKHVYKAEGSTHRHLNWVFTKPGKYTMDVEVKDTWDEVSKPVTLTFDVRDSSVPAGSTPGSETQKPGKPDKGTSGNSKTTVPQQDSLARPTTKPVAKQDRSDGRRELVDGHLDFGPAFVDGKLGFYIGDDVKREHDAVSDGGHNLDHPDKVALVVGENRRFTIGEKGNRGIPENDDTAFLGKKGDHVYYLPNTQDHNAVWPGFDTNKVRNAFPKGMSIEIEPESMPDGAKWWAGHLPSLSNDLIKLADSSGKAVIDREEPFHEHADWFFTKPGTYKIKMRAVANESGTSTQAMTSDGKTINIGLVASGETATNWETIVFEVGGEGAIRAASGSGSTGVQSTSSSSKGTQSSKTVALAKNDNAPKKGVKSLLANTGASPEIALALAMLFVGVGFAAIGYRRMKGAEEL
ncbi:choice-of-anchor M domain-containing protein [Corynebacterium silvaticum]|uniref:Choice-of-anchor M domain-containing protein n=1 Tax=Corynebacterium silvaticum TaxID=2320431 RepID=A0A7Y4LIM5_9CORY|nr:choice-of-anchor M domain-containing protein [Corynebacterium silvaticum]ARU46986.1 choice-of-anchor M domain-containing protein [Corynebacterium silvaticum]NON70774.1 substrate-binding protein [Corynebacterium silvaticum]UWH00236.1 choice-of-anchor M domain-containing protein [Corynebacterium silvaticum]UWH02278.1 choice-of-anchor M domain-containing protein [Corynebacterium silvaticum]UWH04317.1 choice-of-anchor M domain-containing protein [Corynebacterium silvaticum]